MGKMIISYIVFVILCIAHVLSNDVQANQRARPVECIRADDIIDDVNQDGWTPKLRDAYEKQIRKCQKSLISR